MSAAALIVLFLGFMQNGAPDLPSLHGVVRDHTGAVLQGARVELADQSGSTAAQTAVTDAKGEFVIERVAPGAYTLGVQFEGFRPAGVQIRVAARRPIAPQTIVLELASQSQEVTVNADLITTAPNANRDAIVMNDTDLRGLPVFDRDVVGTLSRFLDPPSAGGVTLVVDGMEARKVGVAPSAIQQVKLNQDPYSAEFPRQGRGRIEVITKAGADKYSGSMDFTFRDAHLNARDPFAETRPPEQRRIYEGVLGGPVFDGKRTSFLFTLERREENLQYILFAEGPAGLIKAIVPTRHRSLELSASLTHQLGKNHTLSFRVTSETSSTENQGVGGTTLPESGVDARGDESQVIIGARSVIGRRLLNEFRLLVGHEAGATHSLHFGPHVVVLDAFSGGGAQADQHTTEDHFNLAEALTYARGKHVFKAGIQVPDFSRRGFDDQSNREGTFTFSSLADYSAGRPLSFTTQQGDGHLVFLQKVFGAFLQDQINVNDRLSFTPGIRYDWQNIFTDNNNVAARVSAAYAIDRKTALRGGFGVFYDRAGDGPIREVLRSREDRLVRIILLNPGYPDPFGSGASGATARSIVTLDPFIQIPSTGQFGVGIDRMLRKGSTVAFSYLGSRGVDQFRSRDINAPPPPLYLSRPNPAFGQIRQIESTARQTTHSVQAVIRGQLAPRLSGTVQYTFATADNDTNGISSLPANNYDLASEWGRANFDQRHRLEAMAQLRAGEWMNVGVNVSLASGRPYSILTGRDEYNTGQTNARPPDVARNTLDGPGTALVNLRWSREFHVGSRTGDDAAAWSIGVDAFNVLNHVNYSSYVGTLTSPFFGRAISAQPPRRIQLTAGIHF